MSNLVDSKCKFLYLCITMNNGSATVPITFLKLFQDYKNIIYDMLASTVVSLTTDHRPSN